MHTLLTRMTRCFAYSWIAIYLPTKALHSEDWSSFRGQGDSIARVQSLPIQWEMRGRVAGAWDIRLPGYGQSSPVVWKDRVFVTAVSGELKENLHVLAIDLATGSTLWQKDFEATQKVKDSDAVSRGAPTPAIDADGLLVVFESGDVFALSHDGDLRWKRSFVADHGEIKGPHGYSSSPALCDDRVILQVTHAGPSYVLALSRRDGATLWKTDHPSQTGWSSPILVTEDQQKLAIVSSAGSVRAYDVNHGREQWYVDGLAGNSTASPTYFEHSILIGSGGDREGGGGPRRDRSTSSESSANATPPESVPIPSHKGSLRISLGGEGNVTQSHVAWSNIKANAGYASPLVHKKLAFFVNRVGVVQCVDPQTGKELWTHRLPSQVWASPIGYNDAVMFFCKEGSVVAMEAGPEPKVVAESTISTTDIVYGVAAVEGAWLVRKGRGLQKIVAP